MAANLACACHAKRCLAFQRSATAGAASMLRVDWRHPGPTESLAITGLADAFRTGVGSLAL